MYKVIGRKDTSFTPRGEDKEIRGVNLFLTYEDEDVDGVACERVFVSDGKFISNIVASIGDSVDLRYNKYGKVESVEVL